MPDSVPLTQPGEPTATAAAIRLIVAACKVVHPRNSHHPCGDCAHTITVLNLAAQEAETANGALGYPTTEATT